MSFEHILKVQMLTAATVIIYFLPNKIQLYVNGDDAEEIFTPPELSLNQESCHSNFHSVQSKATLNSGFEKVFMDDVLQLLRAV